jgi:hypothetical protein
MLLARHELVDLMCDAGSKFAITPILDAEQQIGQASIDVRLGPDLVITRGPTGGTAFDPADVDDVTSRLEDYQQYVRRPFGSAVYLHPGDFVLARTLSTSASQRHRRRSRRSLVLGALRASYRYRDRGAACLCRDGDPRAGEPRHDPYRAVCRMRIAQLAFYSRLRHLRAGRRTA